MKKKELKQQLQAAQQEISKLKSQKESIKVTLNHAKMSLDNLAERNTKLKEQNSLYFGIINTIAGELNKVYPDTF